MDILFLHFFFISFHSLFIFFLLPYIILSFLIFFFILFGYFLPFLLFFIISFPFFIFYRFLSFLGHFLSVFLTFCSFFLFGLSLLLSLFIFSLSKCINNKYFANVILNVHEILRIQTTSYLRQSLYHGYLSNVYNICMRYYPNTRMQMNIPYMDTWVSLVIGTLLISPQVWQAGFETKINYNISFHLEDCLCLVL